MSESINETYEETPQSAMQDILDRQRKAYLAEGVVSTATRVDRLERAIQVVKKHQKTFVEAMTQDFGHRSEHQSMFTDIASSVGPLRHAQQHLKNWQKKEKRKVSPGILALLGARAWIEYQPLGVVGVISPWNFPMATAVWKIAPALAFGNAVIFKPANLVPASAWALTEIIARQSALPPGTFNLLMGSGGTVGDHLINSDQIHAVTFTGSLPVGRQVATATAANLVKCQLEMGSKNALIVAADADLEVAGNAAFAGAYSGTGQKCTASSRLIVDDSVHDAFVEKLVAKLAAVRVGHALEEGVDMGPVASEAQLLENLAWVKRGVEEGATLLLGGERLELSSPGYYMSPALFVDTDNAMAINREELFAPIACVIRARDYEHALEILNDTDFGLTAGIITQSLATASDFKKRAVSGCVMVNLPTAGTDYHVPFGGRKASSFGPREQGQYAREFYTTVKTSYLQA